MDVEAANKLSSVVNKANTKQVKHKTKQAPAESFLFLKCQHPKRGKAL